MEEFDKTLNTLPEDEGEKTMSAASAEAYLPDDDELGATRGYKASSVRRSGRYITVFEGEKEPVLLDLDAIRKDEVIIGRVNSEYVPDIMMTSGIVSRRHGRFVLRNGRWLLEDLGSTNGISYCDERISSREIMDGDIYRIDAPDDRTARGVLILVSTELPSGELERVPVGGKAVTIGRSTSCDIVLPHVCVSKVHAVVEPAAGGWILKDNGSTNGLMLNGQQVNGKMPLEEKDVITIVDARIVLSNGVLYVFRFRQGITVSARDVVVIRGKGDGKSITTDHVSLDINPGELVAIVGGSGAGKSTIMNVLCGYLKPEHGHVYINGADLYRNFEILKKQLGYVPQSDIVYNDLKLADMLRYTAKLRLPADTGESEIERVITEAIRMVGLEDKKDLLIKRLSGGQRKRASIAVELLADPGLLFLDEPTSGLDPGTEKSLMTSLKAMTGNGKTVILVTHSTLQLDMCDKVLFMGRGGKLCYFGSMNDARAFFGTGDVVTIYNEITERPEIWKGKYLQNARSERVPDSSGPEKKAGQKKSGSLKVLCRRYTNLIYNDRKRLALLILQAPLLAFLISMVANGQQFVQYNMTKSLLFCLSCSAFWIGMLNAIQEICKERVILKREYMTGLSLTKYILSKVAVLGVACVIQSALLVVMFAILAGVPKDGAVLDFFTETRTLTDTGVIFAPLAEMYITTFLTTLSATGVGLLISGLFSNPDRAMTVAPIMLMPQMLFSGLLFELSGATECISWFTVCRWSMEAYGSTANLNALPTSYQQKGVSIPHDPEKFFEISAGHMLKAWGILLLITAVCAVIARLIIRNVRNDEA